MFLTYAPWVAREGMAGTFAHLVEAWGSPDAWPNAAVREQVCERGTPVPVRWDPYTPQTITVPCEGVAGLTAPTPAAWFEDAGWCRILGSKPYVTEGRETFLSLVPDRYKAPEHPNYREQYQRMGDATV